jgi:hypothetical protein
MPLLDLASALTNQRRRCFGSVARAEEFGDHLAEEKVCLCTFCTLGEKRLRSLADSLILSMRCAKSAHCGQKDFHTGAPAVGRSASDRIDRSRQRAIALLRSAPEIMRMPQNHARTPFRKIVKVLLTAGRKQEPIC